MYKKSTHNDVLLLSIDIRLYDAAVGYGARSWVIHQQLLAFAQIGSLIIGPHKPGKCIEGSAQTVTPGQVSRPQSTSSFFSRLWRDLRRTARLNLLGIDLWVCLP